MKKNKLNIYDLDLYSETLDNGLLINIIPKDNVNNIYVTFSTKYGSIHDEFIPIDSDSYYKVPMGVAHFLEHKVFEQKDGIDPFTYFAHNGADANANTSNYKTTYLFAGPTNFEDNINYLLDYVQEPYFTDENVLKEKGIIEQELKMLKDQPYWRLYEETIDSLFSQHPIKYPVGGTVDTIKKITKEELYTCYNTFYHPSNMFITVSGNINPKEVIDIIKKNQEKKNFRTFKKIKIKEQLEPDKVNVEKKVIPFDINLPKVSLAYKFNISSYDINKARLYLNIYFSLLLGTTSILDEELRNANLISDGLSYEVVNTDKHLGYIINFESNNYDEVLKRLKKTIGIVKVTQEEIDRKKKSAKSSCIYRSDNIYALNSKIDRNIINYGKVILDEDELYNSLNIDELNKLLESLDFNNSSIVILENS